MYFYLALGDFISICQDILIFINLSLWFVVFCLKFEFFNGLGNNVCDFWSDSLQFDKPKCIIRVLHKNSNLIIRIN